MRNKKWKNLKILVSRLLKTFSLQQHARNLTSRTHYFGWLLQTLKQDVIGYKAGAGLPVVNQVWKLDERRWADGCADELLNLTLILNRKHERATMGIMFFKLASKVFRKQQQKFFFGTESEIWLGEMGELSLVASFGEASVNCSELVVEFLEFANRDRLWRHVWLRFLLNHCHFGFFFLKPEHSEVAKWTQHWVYQDVRHFFHVRHCHKISASCHEI